MGRELKKLSKPINSHGASKQKREGNNLQVEVEELKSMDHFDNT